MRRELKMTHRENLEQVLEYILNEEAELASDLLHKVVVQKARAIYEELQDEEEVEIEEEFGGDPKDDFASEIRQSEKEIDADELNDDSDSVDYQDEEGEESEEDEASEEGEVEDRVEDLESALASLRAEFDQLMSQELEEPNHKASDFGIESEEGEAEAPETEQYESMSEATQLTHAVSDLGMSKESGKTIGTGKNSLNSKVSTSSLYTKSPDKYVTGGKAQDFAKTAKQGTEASKGAEEHSKIGNVDAPNKSVKQDSGSEGKFAGTGKNSAASKPQVKSPLSSKPKY